ncbi:unnamed protein product [Hydatigera taeniaeformis]|uniref:SCA7 domain-containing protein n=1 Tax=Hydatigena taeniaeformis TaxID=6205 RepID=A0A158RD87_HYDTA|nr:unnamed protein product [Hydatigera taeniaeformis]
MLFVKNLRQVPLTQLYEAAQLEEKLANKRLKAESIRKSKSLRNLSHTSHFENVSIPTASDRQCKRAKLKPSALSHPTLSGATLERDKMSSSSSYDRLSSGEVNSPGSGTESSSSAPSKLVENLPDPPSGFPRKGVMEILQEESASSSSKTRRICGGLTKPLTSHSLSHSVNLLANSHSQSYPSSPVSPPICDQKESACVTPNGQSTRKKISVRTMQSEHVEIPRICPAKPASRESQVHARMRSQFEPCNSHSMSFKRHHIVRKPPHSVESVETVDLVSNPTPNADTQSPHGYIPSDESAATLFHLDQESRVPMGRSHLMRPNRILRNGSKSNLFDYTNPATTEKSWNASDFSKGSDAWQRSSHLSMAGANCYGTFVDFEPMYSQQTEKRAINSSFAMFNQGLRNSPDRSMVQSRCELDRLKEFTSESMHRQGLQNDTVINLLTHCGCIEMGDLRCKNSILCTTHTFEEKRRVSRSRDLKVLLHEARQQQHLMRLHEASVPTKIRRVSSSIGSPTLPSTSATAASMMASTPRGGLTSSTPSVQRLLTNSNASMPPRRVPMNGITTTAVESQSLAGLPQQQQPTILHRRVHHPSSLLRRNQQMWGQEKSSSSFSAANTNPAAFYTASSSSAATSLLPPPPTSVVAKVARDAGHIGGISEVQSRVVVNDEREKSITGRSRKSSRSGMRQSASSVHSPYIQHLTAASNRANSTAVLLRTSTANQIAAKLRSAAAAARDPATTATWMGYNRVASTSDLQLSVPASSTVAASRHSNSTAPATGPTTMANPHAFGSNRLIFIGSKSLKKSGSGNRLTVVPGLNIIQAPRHHQQRSQTSPAPLIGSTSMHLETPREIIIDAAEEDDGVGIDGDVESVEAAAELEAAVAASAIASASNNVDSIDHHQQFSRTTGGSTHHKTNLRSSLCSVPAGVCLNDFDLSYLSKNIHL